LTICTRERLSGFLFQMRSSTFLRYTQSPPLATPIVHASPSVRWVTPRTQSSPRRTRVNAFSQDQLGKSDTAFDAVVVCRCPCSAPKISGRRPESRAGLNRVTCDHFGLRPSRALSPALRAPRTPSTTRWRRYVDDNFRARPFGGEHRRAF